MRKHRGNNTGVSSCNQGCVAACWAYWHLLAHLQTHCITMCVRCFLLGQVQTWGLRPWGRGLCLQVVHALPSFRLSVTVWLSWTMFQFYMQPAVQDCSSMESNRYAPPLSNPSCLVEYTGASQVAITLQARTLLDSSWSLNIGQPVLNRVLHPVGCQPFLNFPRMFPTDF